VKLYHVLRSKLIHESDFISGSANSFIGIKLLFTDEFDGVVFLILAFVLIDITVGALTKVFDVFEQYNRAVAFGVFGVKWLEFCWHLLLYLI
jgi:hypothetical protein